MSFDLPAFNGSVRLTAVAWSKDKVGSAQADVTVRDAVVVAATLPRFLNVGDRSEMHVDIDNVEGEAGDYTLDLDIHGPLTADADAMRKTVRLDARQRQSLSMPITAAGVGTADLALRLTGPKTDLTQQFKLGLASGAPDAYRRTVKPLPGGASCDHFRRSRRRLRSGDRLDRDLGFAVRRPRRAGLLAWRCNATLTAVRSRP